MTVTLSDRHTVRLEKTMAIEPITLSPEDKETLEKLRPDIEALEKEVARAERAGLDVTAVKKDLEKSRALLEGILREYAG